mmetsp:Transcript_24358/g.54927  ORF Transcript_24358/g.54927 Transcript_24358/m.54927 type:complete len:412 (+) Transcript_24358:193-1428(+)
MMILMVLIAMMRSSDSLDEVPKSMGRVQRRLSGPHDLPLCVSPDEADIITAPRPSIESQHADPRLKRTCQSVFGTRSVSRSFASVNTVEDVIAANKSAGEAFINEPTSSQQLKARKELAANIRGLRGVSHCGLLHPYGRFVRDSVLYLEIPKVSTTSMKNYLPLCKAKGYGEGDFLSPFGAHSPIFSTRQRAFVIVREPLERFLSGYGTVRSRVLSRKDRRVLPYEMEVARFVDFVRVVADEGAFVMARQPPKNCKWCHILSQMWFIEMYPRRIDFVLRLEKLEADLALLKVHIPAISLPAGPPIHRNVNSTTSHAPGGLRPSELKRAAPDAIGVILEYLKQDYACLGYPNPDLRNFTGHATRKETYPAGASLAHDSKLIEQRAEKKRANKRLARPTGPKRRIVRQGRGKG